VDRNVGGDEVRDCHPDSVELDCEMTEVALQLVLQQQQLICLKREPKGHQGR
jgi:hypothetical protein